MRDRQPIDIHNYPKRLERAIRLLETHPKISHINKQLVVKFLNGLKAEGVSIARQAGYVQRLTAIAIMLEKNVDGVTRQDIEKLMIAINGRK